MQKKRLYQILVLVLSLCVGITSLPAQTRMGGQRAGTSIFTFLKIGVGARALGMGDTGVSLAADATALYWNPAAAAQVGHNNFTISYTKWLVDIDYNYFGYIHHLSKNIFLGLSAGALYTEPMEVTTEYRPYGTGEYFSYGDLFLGLTFSQKMTDRFSYGVTLKYVEETLADLSMRNVLIDLGTYYWTGFRTLRFCVALVNFGAQSRPDGRFLRPLKEGGTEEIKYALFSPPTEFRIGAAMDVIENPNFTTMLSMQLNHPVDNAENLVLGLEERLYGRYFLRGGWILAQAERNFALGAGLQLPLGKFTFCADYAWSDFGILDDIQKFQMSIGF
jgi:hypothetical protein